MDLYVSGLFYAEVLYYRTGHLTSHLLCSSLQQSAERCVSTLLDLIQTKVNYVVQEAIVVIRDIFRKYPNKYVLVLLPLFLRSLRGCLSEALWIGEERIILCNIARRDRMLY